MKAREVIALIEELKTTLILEHKLLEQLNLDKQSLRAPKFERAIVLQQEILAKLTRLIERYEAHKSVS